MTKKLGVKQQKTFTTPQSLNNEIKAICDIMRRCNCAGAVQYVPELTWILFLRILDLRENEEQETAEVLGNDFSPSLKSPYRWSDWGSKNGKKRKTLIEGKMGAYFEFINTGLIAYVTQV